MTISDEKPYLLWVTVYKTESRKGTTANQIATFMILKLVARKCILKKRELHF